MTNNPVGRLLTLTLIISTAAGLSAAQSSPSPVVHNTWTSGAPIPTAVWCPMVAALNGQIYVVGGTNSNGKEIADTQIYDPATNTWSTGTALPTPNCAGVAAVVKDTLYIIGGYPYTSRVWAYDLTTKTWSAKAPMPKARTDMGVAVLNGTIYVVGGNTRPQNRITTVESYNPVSNTWTEEAPLPVGKSEPSVALVGNLYSGFSIVAADGYTAGGDTGDNQGYNAITNAWTSLSGDTSPRNAACTGRIGEGLYIAGGYLGYGSALSLNESFTYFHNTWQTLAPLPQATLFSGSTVYQGKLYCIGGSLGFASGVLTNVQIYQP